MPESGSKYVSRGGDKLDFALKAFELDVAGSVAADLGSNVGGFVDCLLQHGAARVYSVDTSYGTLAWKLRQDPRVVVIERQNAMHVQLPEPVDVVTIDVGWTRQHLILPHALKLLRPGGIIVSLLKPQYEAEPHEVHRGVVAPELAPLIADRVIQNLLALSLQIDNFIASPITGGKGNVEFLLKVTGG